MRGSERLDRLRADGRMQWVEPAQAWRGEPDEIVNALAEEGYQECKREVARVPRSGAAGGLWQGLDSRTGSVASAVWVRVREPLVFIHIDGEPLRGR